MADLSKNPPVKKRGALLVVKNFVIDLLEIGKKVGECIRSYGFKLGPMRDQ